jgi:hypothetical protein
MNARFLFPTKPASRLLAGAVALLVVSAAFPGPAWAIVNGEPDGNGHPNVGAIVVYHPAYGIIPYGSGTLIHPRVFLTAGHAVAAIESGEVVVLGVSFSPALTVGDPLDPLVLLDLYSVERAVGISNTPARSGAVTPSPKQADIGALILAEPVTDIVPAVLPGPGLLDALKDARQLQDGRHGTTFTQVGYGWALDFPPPEMVWPYEVIEVLYEGQTVLFWGGQRNTVQIGYIGFNDAWLILSQVAGGDGGIENGDSGGPTLWTDPNGNEILVSIAAARSQLGIGLYYRIDTAESLQFIQDAIDSLGDE